MMPVRTFTGTVTVATPVGTPTVKRDGDSTAATAKNAVFGWTPAVNDRVIVAYDGRGGRTIVNKL